MGFRSHWKSSSHPPLIPRLWRNKDTFLSLLMFSSLHTFLGTKHASPSCKGVASSGGGNVRWLCALQPALRLMTAWHFAGKRNEKLVSLFTPQIFGFCSYMSFWVFFSLSSLAFVSVSFISAATPRRVFHERVAGDIWTRLTPQINSNLLGCKSCSGAALIFPHCFVRRTSLNPRTGN